ncbi:MAG TPA: type IV pilus secretin PilQ [Terriglobia bacterium]|nr:type IV pilus secretin PilQ [Terriglobia bacterium]
MKRSYLMGVAAMCAATGLVSIPAARQTAKTSTVALINPPNPGSPAVRDASDAAASAQKSGPARLTGISIRRAESGNGTEIEVATSSPTEYRVLHLDHPNRLVLDLEGAINKTHRWRYSSDLPLLARIRVGRFSEEHGGVIRVVADLKEDAIYHVDRDAAGFRIELVPRHAAVTHANLTPEVEANQPVRSALQTGLNSPSKTAVEARTASREKVVTEAKAELQPKHAALKEAAEVTSSAPAEKESVKPVSGETRAATPAAGSVPSNVATGLPGSGDPPLRAIGPRQTTREQNFPQVREAARAAKVMANAEEAALSRVVVPVTRNAGVEEAPKYTGKRISLNLKGVDLKDFFRLIHEVSGLNIIVDPDVSGSVTTVLDDVPWDQALALVLNDNGLGDKLEGNVLRIAKLSTLEREEEDQQKLLLAREESEPLHTVFRRLNYAKAADLAALLKTWAGGGALSRRGSVLVDERTNTLIISDIPSHIPKIEAVIDRLDQKAQQISIQARIIRATNDFVRNLSTALSYAQRNASGSLTTGGATGNPVSGQPLTPPTVTTAPATGFGVFVLSNLGSNYVINAAIAAAETRDQAKTISEPSIVTQNNVEGTVIQGTQIPIQTTINNTISVQYVQASLQLKVTPQVTQDGNVFLTIEVQNSSPGPALTFAGPTINTQSATTQVLVPNGGTVIFGGVTVHTKSNSATQVPWLGSIPILGHLFKSSTRQENDQQLLFFVTPKILT